MPERFFEKFPTISYANNVVINITERAALLNRVANNPNLFYPMDITDGARADQIADNYYDDPYMSWILYLSNNVIDPYYDWYLQNDQFEKLLIKKYNVFTSDILREKVIFYRNNWYESEQITVDEYNTQIAGTSLVKYWDPVFNGLFKPIAYQRKQEDWVAETNNMVTYEIANEGTFIRDEIVDIYLDWNFRGKAQVAYANATHVTIKHTFGYVLPSTNYNFMYSEDGSSRIQDEQSDFIINEDTPKLVEQSYIYGRESGSNNHIITATQFKVQDDSLIPFAERMYWSPVYIYDYESELNEKNKSISVINKIYSQQIAEELKNILE